MNGITINQFTLENGVLTLMRLLKFCKFVYRPHSEVKWQHLLKMTRNNERSWYADRQLIFTGISKFLLCSV